MHLHRLLLQCWPSEFELRPSIQVRKITETARHHSSQIDPIRLKDGSTTKEPETQLFRLQFVALKGEDPGSTMIPDTVDVY